MFHEYINDDDQEKVSEDLLKVDDGIGPWRQHQQHLVSCLMKKHLISETMKVNNRKTQYRNRKTQYRNRMNHKSFEKLNQSIKDNEIRNNIISPQIKCLRKHQKLNPLRQFTNQNNQISSKTNIKLSKQPDFITNKQIIRRYLQYAKNLNRTNLKPLKTINHSTPGLSYAQILKKGVYQKVYHHHISTNIIQPKTKYNYHQRQFTLHIKGNSCIIDNL